MKTNLANWCTASRIFLAFPIFFLLINSVSYFRIIAFVLFCVAGFTDYLDGKIARTYQLSTPFGKFFDPLADKILVISVLIGLTIIGEVQLWMVLLIIAREILVTFLRAGNVEKFSPTILAKSKTAFQIFGIAIILFVPYFNLPVFIGQSIVYIIMFGILLVTVVSGVEYFFIARK